MITIVSQCHWCNGINGKHDERCDVPALEKLQKGRSVVSIQDGQPNPHKD